MADSVVREAVIGKRIVGGELVGVNGASARDVFCDESAECFGIDAVDGR